MTEEGFNPKNIEIQQGTTIIFKNMGSQEHWPASNIHPDHTVYPGSDIKKCGTNEANAIFDSCGGIKPGEEYSFKFDNVGRWRFHDHILPELSGEIKVFGGNNDQGDGKNNINSPDKNFWQKARDIFFNKLVTKIYNLVPRTTIAKKVAPREIDEAMDSVKIFDIVYDHKKLALMIELAGEKRVLAKLSKEAGQGVLQDCHQQTHQVGVVSYRLYGNESLKRGDTTCLSGFYHGVMGELISKWKGENLAQNISELCGSFENKYDKFECLHGAGHGVLAYEDYDLPIALEACDGISDEWQKGSCHSGIFHENVAVAAGLGVVPGHETKWVNENNPYFPCNSSVLKKDPVKEFQCYQVQTGLMLKFANHDFSKVSKLCAKAPERNRASCFRSFGRDVGGSSLRDSNRIIELCDYVPRKNGYYVNCIEGALTSSIIRDFRGTESGLIQEGRKLCSLITEKEAKASCEGIVVQKERESY